MFVVQGLIPLRKGIDKIYRDIFGILEGHNPLVFKIIQIQNTMRILKSAVMSVYVSALWHDSVYFILFLGSLSIYLLKKD